MRYSFRTAASAIVLSSFFLAGCGDNHTRTDRTESGQAAPEETLLKTSGRVVFEGIPTDGLTAREVIVLESLEPEAKERVLRQRQLFEYRASGQNPELEEAERRAQLEISPEKRRELDRRLIDLRIQFPEPLMLDVRIDEEGVDDDRIRKVSSDFALHEEYQELFRAIRLENLKRGVDFIADKLKKDGTAWSDRQTDEDPFAAKKASATVQWINAVVQHLNAYVALGNNYIAAQKEHAAQLADDATKLFTWEEYVDRFGQQLIIDISKEELAAAKIGEDGSFEVDAQGDLLVRLEYGYRSAYCLVDDPAEQRVSVADLSVWNAENAADP